jgi:hypothetical protein
VPIWSRPRATPNAGYLEGIREAHRGEVYGEFLFAALAERTRSAERREKWHTLARLEFETRGRLAPILSRLDAAAQPPSDLHSKAVRDAEFLAALRWHDLMDLLHAEVTPFISRFEALERLGPPEDRPILARVTAHEVALQSFARLELAGRGGESIQPTLALLEVPAEASRAAAAC